MGTALPWPRVMYPLDHNSKGQEVTGRGSEVILRSVTFTDVTESERQPGALQMSADLGKYAELPFNNSALKFQVSQLYI